MKRGAKYLAPGFTGGSDLQNHIAQAQFNLTMANYHLVVLKKPYLNAILAGQKRIESRFAKTRREPFGQVLPGDKLFLKASSGPVCAAATVAAVKIFDNLTPRKIAEIKQQYNHHIRGSDKYWRSKAHCRFGLLVQLKDVKPIKPVRIHKKDWRAWVVLTAKENFGLLEMDGLLTLREPNLR